MDQSVKSSSLGFGTVLRRGKRRKMERGERETFSRSLSPSQSNLRIPKPHAKSEEKGDVLFTRSDGRAVRFGHPPSLDRFPIFHTTEYGQKDSRYGIKKKTKRPHFSPEREN